MKKIDTKKTYGVKKRNKKRSNREKKQTYQELHNLVLTIT